MFDPNSGIRERLALLASQGPTDATDWSYDTRFDCWFRFERGGTMRRVKVTTEGSASLDKIATSWNIPRAEAMAFIGYPDTP